MEKPSCLLIRVYLADLADPPIAPSNDRNLAYVTSPLPGERLLSFDGMSTDM